jgi:myo-inositol 2-dehydrogenase/D-chiro-inositol 1-dehydrogenase
MSSQIQGSGASQPSRRDFVRGAAAVGAAAMAVGSMPSFVHAAENNTLKIGLVGCGGRGGGAAINALKADSNIKLVALADMFKDKLDAGLLGLKSSPLKAQVDVPPERQFTGWDGYKGVIEACDVVLLATPPHFRPMHLKAAVEAGKHIFCEKPVATDAPGLRSVIETCEEAKKKKLTLVSGLCYRYDQGKIETVKRIHEGAVGEITAIQGNYLTTGLWSNPRKPEWSDMEWQLRNWLYFTWLSGDMITEQHIHTLDKVLWLMKDEMPLKVQACGGRACRTAPNYGNVYDHFNTIFEWKSGVRAFCAARQWDGADPDVSDWVYGTEGHANLQDHIIWGKEPKPWKRKAGANMYDLEHVALFKSIRSGEPINNGDYMIKATGMALMGRMAAYTGKTVTWEQALGSQENLAPAKYEFGPLEVAPIAVPGKTKLA